MFKNNEIEIGLVKVLNHAPLVSKCRSIVPMEINLYSDKSRDFRMQTIELQPARPRKTDRQPRRHRDAVCQRVVTSSMTHAIRNQGNVDAPVQRPASLTVVVRDRADVAHSLDRETSDRQPARGDQPITDRTRTRFG